MQGRELDGDAGTIVDASSRGRFADRMDRVLVSHVITLRVLGGGRGFAEHVVGMAKSFGFALASVGQRLLDRLAGHELLAHQPHAEVHTLADQRFATLGDETRQRARHARLARRRDQLAGDHQPQVAALTNRDCALLVCAAQSPPPILSRMSASRVAVSGMRSSASARHISATPSWLDRENS